MYEFNRNYSFTVYSEGAINVALKACAFSVKFPSELLNRNCNSSQVSVRNLLGDWETSQLIYLLVILLGKITWKECAQTFYFWNFQLLSNQSKAFTTAVTTNQVC